MTVRHTHLREKAIRHTHLREKAIELRSQHNLTLDELVERLGLPRTTIYYWIKDLPIPRTEQQSAARQRASDANRDRARAKRDAAYQQGWEEASTLLADPVFRDFVVLYMGEGGKKNRNRVVIVNSDPAIIKLANRFMGEFSARKLSYWLLVLGSYPIGFNIMQTMTRKHSSNSGVTRSV